MGIAVDGKGIAWSLETGNMSRHQTVLLGPARTPGE